MLSDMVMVKALLPRSVYDQLVDLADSKNCGISELMRGVFLHILENPSIVDDVRPYVYALSKPGRPRKARPIEEGIEEK